MADVQVTITIPDALVARVGAALGVSTKAQFEGWVRDRVKEAVVSHELDQAEQSAKTTLETAKQAYDTAIETAESTAKSEINLT